MEPAEEKNLVAVLQDFLRANQSFCSRNKLPSTKSRLFPQRRGGFISVLQSAVSFYIYYVFGPSQCLCQFKNIKNNQKKRKNIMKTVCDRMFMITYNNKTAPWVRFHRRHAEASSKKKKLPRWGFKSRRLPTRSPKAGNSPREMTRRQRRRVFGRVTVKRKKTHQSGVKLVSGMYKVRSAALEERDGVFVQTLTGVASPVSSDSKHPPAATSDHVSVLTGSTLLAQETIRDLFQRKPCLMSGTHRNCC